VTIDKSLKRKGRLARSRNVLKREERIAFLKSDERWPEGRSPLGLPKVRVTKSTVGKKKKKKKEEGEDAAATTAAPAAAGGKGAAPAAKGAAAKAAPAKGAGGKK
jgi:small basic protein (TIGR04137 family)